MKCPHCQKEFNAGKVMGSAKTPAKTAAAKKRGEFMKRAFANQKKMEEGDRRSPGLVREPNIVLSPIPSTSPFIGIAPKGSFTKDDLKAMISGNRAGMSGLAAHAVVPDMSNVPHAPFDLNIEGEPHRVRQIGKKLMLVYLGTDGEVPVRPLVEGELESFWAKRIIK